MIFPPQSKARFQPSQSMLQSLVSYFSRMTAGSLLGSFHLPVNIQTTDGLSWSEDGKLAITTKKGVYVFEITPNARGNGGPKARNTKNTINFVKTFVEAELSSNPGELESLLSEDELASLPRSLRTEVMLDRLVCPHLPTGTAGDTENPFRQHCKVGTPGDCLRLALSRQFQVGWTPVTPGSPACLMTLSLDRRLKILQQRGR